MRVCVLVRAFVCVCRSVCARTCARARACAFVCACECGFAVPSASVFEHVLCVGCACACVCGTTVCVRLGAEWALRGPAVLIARPAAARARFLSVRCDRL